MKFNILLSKRLQKAGLLRGYLFFNKTLTFMVQYFKKLRHRFMEIYKKSWVKSEIEKINGLKVIEKSECQYVQFSTDLTYQDLESLIHFLRKHKIAFSFYDFLYPSISDGTYLIYSQLNNDSEKHWNMTLDNHGWFGGVFQIEESIILKQLENLIKKNLIQDIQIERVVSFLHFKNAETNRNQFVNDRILEIHTNRIQK